jgi:RimJ/RimL family protein N-acetyltransferase
VGEVLLRRWSEDDLPLLEKLLGDPEMMEHLGGPESAELILRRHIRYTRLPVDGTDHMFKIVWGGHGEGVGNVGYWRKTWREQSVYEIGWLVLPSFQGRGIATRAAAEAIEHARREAKYRFMHAFPSAENAASNAICRKLGFTLIEECQFEYPAGRSMRVNDWRLTLFQP